jgi:hypothetical protein
MVGSASGASWVRERLNGDGRMLSLMWLPTYRLYVVASDGDRPRYAVDLARALEAVTGVAPDEEWCGVSSVASGGSSGAYRTIAATSSRSTMTAAPPCGRSWPPARRRSTYPRA